MSAISPGEGDPPKKSSNLRKLECQTTSQGKSDIVDLTSQADQQMEISQFTGFSPSNTLTHTLDPISTENSGQQKASKVFNLNNLHLYSNSFYVYIESIDQNLGRLHPMYVGHILLKKLKIKNIVTINSMGKNRIRVVLKSAFDANVLINNKQLENEKLRAFIPNHLVERKGLIRSVDTYFNEEYIKNNIESSSPVVDVKRINRKIQTDGSEKWIPRQLVIVTFEGNILPSYVVINSVHFAVEPYISKVIQCYKCLKYGHVSKQCRSTKTLCTNCGKEKLDNHKCDPKDAFCNYCKDSSHDSTSNKCPKYENQKKIKVQMSLNNIPFIDAKNKVENSFSSIASGNKFFVLANEEEFPSLPNPTSRRKNFSISQPTTSSQRNQITLPSQSNKKRRIEKSPDPHILNENRFTFRFGPDKPLPPNCSKPNFETSSSTDNMIDYFNNGIKSIFKNIQNSHDLKNLNINQIKIEFSRILEDVLQNSI